jgi:dimethylargininase
MTDSMIALTRAPAATLADCELTYLEREPIDVERARRQHAAYCQALRACGAEVITLPPDDALPDSTFVEDTAVIFHEVAVMAVLGAASRRAEAAAVEPIIGRWRRIERVPAPATLEGGDVLVVGRTVFAGLSARTNAGGIEALRAVLAPHGYRVVAVPVTGCLHLKTACTALDERRLLVNPDWIDCGPLAGYELVRVPPGEPFGANVLCLGETRLVPAGAPATRALVARLGYTVCPVDISEFAKAEGGLTCLSLLVTQHG